MSKFFMWLFFTAFVSCPSGFSQSVPGRSFQIASDSPTASRLGREDRSCREYILFLMIS